MVLSDEIYSRLLFEGEQFSIVVGRWHEGPHHHSRRLLEDLCHDRLAHGLRRDAADLADADRAADDQFQLLHRELHADGGDRGDARRPERDRRGCARSSSAAAMSSWRASTRSRDSRCRLPKGAFYTFPNIKQTGWPSKKLADALLDEAGVAALSGTAFGAFGEGYLRFSMANSIENLQHGAGPHRPVDEEAFVVVKVSGVEGARLQPCR